ncbi:hypothetical protein Fcan01_27689 [Folsomia candida]|uniref:Uncharacterized protein n=1 Tax=Folsomia candida TaxID=158441 RepID=A0A226CYD5_FOLCA|nr:hypothetical protein Fcan01_27689 [Folsomia candida]
MEEQFAKWPSKPFSTNKAFSRPQYHALLHPGEARNDTLVWEWNYEMGTKVLDENELAQLLIFQTTQKNKLDQFEINNVLLCCKYCNKYHRTFVPKSLSSPAEIFKPLDQIWGDVGLYVIISLDPSPIKKPYKTAPINMRLSQIYTLPYTSDHYILSLLEHSHLINFSVHFVTKKPGSISLSVDFPCEEEMPKFNLTWEDYFYKRVQLCDRTFNSFPIINTKSQWNIRLQKSIKSFTFLTCFLPKEKLPALEILLKVFDPITWSYLGLTLLISCLYLAATINPKRHNVSRGTAFTFPIEMLLEHGNSTGQNTSGEWSLYFVLAPVILSFLVVSSAFKGDNMTSIIAPVEQIRFEKFDSLFTHNFSFFADFIPYPYHGGVGIISEFKYVLERTTLTSCGSMENLISNKSMKSLLTRKIQRNKRMDGRFVCKNFAFLGFKDKLKERKAVVEKMYKRYNWGLGVESVATFPSGWEFSNVIDQRLLRGVNILEESGIRKKVIEFEELGLSLKERKNKSLMGAGVAYLGSC